MFSKKLQWAIGLALVLMFGGATSPAHAEESVAQTLRSRATAAYSSREFIESAHLFDQVIAAGDASASNFYNAACSYALAEEKDPAFARLASAIESGFLDTGHLRSDQDLLVLHDDPRWQPIVEKMEAAKAADPTAMLLERVQDRTRPIPARYFAITRALREGSLPDPSRNSMLPAFHAFLATFVGDYEAADAAYRVTATKLDPAASGHTLARPLPDAVLPLTRDRRAVFVNEAHGNAATRLATFLLLRPLREQGFTHLALEALSVEKAAGDDCRNATIADDALEQRGYPVAQETSGYYLNDPVFAELVREALRLGYRLVAYESMADGPNDIPTREQGQADNLACLFEENPDAKVLLLGGFSHIGKNPNLAGGQGQGWMAYRFMRKTGIEPLSIDTTALRGLSVEALEYAGGTRRPDAVYALENAEGALLGDPASGFDVSLSIPANVGRDASPNWLELGGTRVGTAVSGHACREYRPCLIEAAYAEEDSAAVPADRCVLHQADASGCRLYLRPSTYRLRYFNEELKLLHESKLAVRHATAGTK